jgi:FkbM family methyltransferase
MIVKRSIKRHPLFKGIIGKFPDPGVFVEFGAYDGKKHSTAHHLVKRGWSGYYTEPMPGKYKECVDNYSNNKKVVVDSVAIGSSEGWLKMHVADLCSTGNDAFQEHTKETEFKWMITGQEIKVRMTTLNLFLEKHSVPENFELLVVDVEGMEWKVFRGFDIKKWGPQAILVEMHRTMFDWKGVGESYKNTEAFLLKNGYEIAVETGIDTLFYK